MRTYIIGKLEISSENYETNITFESAVRYCKYLPGGGWRLPTLNECNIFHELRSLNVGYFVDNIKTGVGYWMGNITGHTSFNIVNKSVSYIEPRFEWNRIVRPVRTI